MRTAISLKSAWPPSANSERQRDYQKPYASRIAFGSTLCVSADLVDFAAPDLKHRLLRGGLPRFFLAASFPERDFQE